MLPAHLAHFQATLKQGDASLKKHVQSNDTVYMAYVRQALLGFTAGIRPMCLLSGELLTFNHTFAKRVQRRLTFKRTVSVRACKGR